MKGSKTVPIKGVDNKWHITATFTVTLLPIQLMYSGKTKRSILRYDFPSCFYFTFTPNPLSSYQKCVRFFEKIIFPYVKTKKEELDYPKHQYSLIVMDTLKGQHNAEIKALCLKKYCEFVIVPHNLTNKFQSFDIPINQKAKIVLVNS